MPPWRTRFAVAGSSGGGRRAGGRRRRRGSTSLRPPGAWTATENTIAITYRTMPTGSHSLLPTMEDQPEDPRSSGPVIAMLTPRASQAACDRELLPGEEVGMLRFLGHIAPDRRRERLGRRRRWPRSHAGTGTSGTR